MSSRKKKIIWHKKTSRFLPAKVLRPHGSTKTPTTHQSRPTVSTERLKEFQKKLTAQIRQVL